MGHDLIARLAWPVGEELGLGSILLRVALSALFAAVIGCERSSKRHSAGLRTFILVSIAGVSAMLIDQWLMAFSGVKLPVCRQRQSSAWRRSAETPSCSAPATRSRGLTTSVGLWCCGLLGMFRHGAVYARRWCCFWCCFAVCPVCRCWKSTSGPLESF